MQIAAIPQCIEATKQLYDMRERFDQAAVTITAIYTESMVIAASLSQIQKLLQSTTLQNNPELCETLDRALTGCWLVYQCVDEEVRVLAQKIAVEDLRKRDRARFLLKESNFKELLQQIRGQQSALGLLVQGLQMESLSDMHKLIGDNSLKLDEIARRSNTLRQKHPDINVPESILDRDGIHDIQSIFGDAQFAFDDKVINSEAYQRAMAQATLQGRAEKDDNEKGIIEGDLNDLSSLPGDTSEGLQLPKTLQGDMSYLILEVDEAIEQNDATSAVVEQETSQMDFLDDLERSMLPFMPPAPLTPQPSVVVTATESTSCSSPPGSSIVTRESTINTMVSSVGEDMELVQNPPKGEDVEETEELPPPLPPRRPSPLQLSNNARKSHELQNLSSWEEIFAPLSTTSPLSLTNPSSVETDKNTIDDTDDKVISIWISILSEEETFITQLNSFRTVFYEGIIKEWPVLKQHLEAIVLMERLASLHQEFVLGILRERLSRHPPATDNSQIFIKWASKTYKVVKEYSQRYPHALCALRITRDRDKKFSPYVEAIGFGPKSIGKTWEDHLLLPIVQLNNYIQKLENLSQCKQGPVTLKDQKRHKEAVELLQKLSTQCSNLQEQAFRQEDLQTLHRRLHSADVSLVERLHLLAPERRVLTQSPLAFKPNGNGPWRLLQVILLDNHLLWGKTKPLSVWKHQDRKEDNIWIVDQVSDLLIGPDTTRD